LCPEANRNVLMRFVSWNIDGAARTLDLPTSSARARSASEHLALSDLHQRLGAPDVLALQEVRIRANDAPLISKLEHALPGYVCSHSLCRDPINVRFRGGRAYGVATFVRAELGPKWVERSPWDHEGRLVAFELPQCKWMVANVYAVNGTDKPYFDPESGAQKGDRHTFKRQFQTQLLDYCRSARERGLELVLMGDWNVSRTSLDTHPRLRTEPPHVTARALLNDVFMPALELEDVFRARNPDRRAYTWFNRVAARYGRLDAARVDYALISKSLSSAVIDADIVEDQALVLGSDHAPLTLEIGCPPLPGPGRDGLLHWQPNARARAPYSVADPVHRRRR
jgi:exodeoxyribonuclease III